MSRGTPCRESALTLNTYILVDFKASAAETALGSQTYAAIRDAATAIRPRVGLAKLRQKTGIALVKEPDVRNPVPEHGDPGRAHAERVARIPLRVVPYGLEHGWVHGIPIEPGRPLISLKDDLCWWFIEAFAPEDLDPPGSETALADKIFEVLNDPVRLALMSARNRETAGSYCNEALDTKRVEFYSWIKDATEKWLMRR